MSKKRKKSPPLPPKQPYSFQQAVDLILDDEDFAEFIHGEILKARDSHQPAAIRQAAADTVAKFFRPRYEELEALKLPRWLLDHKDVNDKMCTTTHMLLDFATPAQIW
jgi:hypothetical protein